MHFVEILCSEKDCGKEKKGGEEGLRLVKTEEATGRRKKMHKFQENRQPPVGTCCKTEDRVLRKPEMPNISGHPENYTKNLQKTIVGQFEKDDSGTVEEG